MSDKRSAKQLTFYMLTAWFASACLGCAADSGDAIANFQSWCGDHACAWIVEEGEVKQVPTWHKRSYGLGMLSDPTVVFQVYRFEPTGDDGDYGASTPQCLVIRLLGDFTPDARLTVELDFFNDGADDRDARIEIPDPDWATIHREATIPASCDAMRMSLRKEGAGRVTLAQVEVLFDIGCAADPQLVSADAGL